MLLHEKIWFSRISKLNDPLEGALAPYSFLPLVINGLERVVTKTSVASFTERFDNMAMWSHYSRCDGICVEYDATGSAFKEIRSVRYVNKLSDIHSSYLSSEFGMEKLLFYKTADWAYEKEWRIIAKAEGYSEQGAFRPKAIYSIHKMLDPKLKLHEKIALDAKVDFYHLNHAVMVNENLNVQFVKKQTR